MEFVCQYFRLNFCYSAGFNCANELGFWSFGAFWISRVLALVYKSCFFETVVDVDYKIFNIGRLLRMRRSYELGIFSENSWKPDARCLSYSYKLGFCTTIVACQQNQLSFYLLWEYLWLTLLLLKIFQGYGIRNLFSWDNS